MTEQSMPERRTRPLGIVVAAALAGGAIGFVAYTAAAERGPSTGPAAPDQQESAHVVEQAPRGVEQALAPAETDDTAAQQSPVPEDWSPTWSSITRLDADIAATRDFYQGASVGDSCDIADAAYRDQVGTTTAWPVLAPFGDFAEDGSCTIGGWVYEVMPDDINELVDVPVYKESFLLAPIFDDTGAVIGYMDPPEVIVDSSQFPPDPEDWPENPVDVARD